VEVLVAGGVNDLDAVRRLRDAGVAGLILGEALLSGSIDFPRALETAA
jgi:phosphoribosylformimino-5-aminoimidazole carboxamide ribotide isomerase